jgi:predicted HNH restriction endonuclease
MNNCLPIASFPMTATIAKVNDIKNLIVLCPNCHWKYDHGLLDLLQMNAGA